LSVEGRDDDREGTPGESFADLIGATRPLKSDKRVVAPAPPDSPQPRQTGDSGASPERFRHPDPDEPRLAAAPGVNDQQLFALLQGKPEPEERIDLHGLRADAAPRILSQRIESASSRGLRSILVIHGKGGGGEAVLRDRLPDWLMRSPNAQRIAAIAPAPSRLGGDGATLVLLAKSRGMTRGRSGSS
jgi:DNA-nicking Smr family endonuclease